ncbi:MAG: YeeE/YedE family protein [Flavobacteriaceae bacterium TMED42]|nr:MAG: YeeE/YedE family protein [Flavobacteriaceae bacterium TMED42]|tara:strand:- start:2879 stop:3295 length:417 start_codon:yes stop_codon:yes gene_type:complete
MKTVLFFTIGILFGIILYMSEVASWFRIYEMFQFDSFHMYGVIGTAVFLGVIIVFIIKKFEIKSILDSTPIAIPNKEKGWKRYLFGGIIFGSGWAISGACPGPMFSLLGAGFLPILIVIVSATLGTFFYGFIQHKLPH